MSDLTLDPCYFTEVSVDKILRFFTSKACCSDRTGSPIPFCSATCFMIGLSLIILSFPLLLILSFLFFLGRLIYEAVRLIGTCLATICDVYEEEEEQPISLNLPPSTEELKRAINLILEYGDEDLQIVTCAVCKIKQVDTVLSPCHHARLCRDCADRIETCPFCRQTIDRRLGIFL